MIILLKKVRFAMTFSSNGRVQCGVERYLDSLLSLDANIKEPYLGLFYVASGKCRAPLRVPYGVHLRTLRPTRPDEPDPQEKILIIRRNP
jgi:hypothetical protein